MIHGTPFTVDRMKVCLETLPPVTLSGLTLLQTWQCQPITATPDGWFPGNVPRDALVAATVELIEYTTRSAQVIYRLRALQPVPSHLTIVEFGI